MSEIIEPLSHEVAMGAMKAAPAVGVSGMSVTGFLDNFPLHELVLLATLVYTLFLLYFLLRDKWYRPMMSEYRKRERARKRNEAAQDT